MSALHFGFDHSFARDVPAGFRPGQPARAPAPQLVFLNRPLARELGLDPAAWTDTLAADVFSGNRLPEDARPIAQAYAGHQFGGFSPQLGDGRALLLGELIDRQGRRRDLAFKGSGRTPFSRGGDGKAALGPMLREVLIGEALQALGVPTTRALAVVATGEAVRRDRPLPGAVLTRVAASHLRVGSLQYFAARGEADTASVSVLKLFGSEAERQALENALTSAGPDGLIHPSTTGPYEHMNLDYCFASWFERYARSFSGTIAGGTSEIQRNIIATQVLGLPRR